MKSIAKFFFLGVGTVAGTGVYSPQVLIISHISIYANKEWEPEKETSGMMPMQLVKFSLCIKKPHDSQSIWNCIHHLDSEDLQQEKVY